MLKSLVLAQGASPVGDLQLSIGTSTDRASEDRASDAALHTDVLELFDSYASGLRRYVRSCGVDHEAVDDVVQEAFLALFHHLRRGGQRHNLRGWLVQVSYRLSLKQRYRSSRRQRVEISTDAVLDEVADAADDVERRLMAKDRAHRLRAVFRALPERDRQCLILRAEGVRYREIARTLGVSLGTVAASLARAVARLSTAITDRQQ